MSADATPAFLPGKFTGAEPYTSSRPRWIALVYTLIMVRVSYIGTALAFSIKTTGMKKMLIAATTIGAALAGTILYMRQKSSRPALSNTKDNKQLQDRGGVEMHRPPMHAMG